MKATFYQPRVAGIPQLPGVPHFHVNRPLVWVTETWHNKDIENSESFQLVILRKDREFRAGGVLLAVKMNSLISSHEITDVKTLIEAITG